MKRKILSLTLIVAGIFILSSCYRDSEEGLYRFAQASCDTTNVTYSGTISAIVAGNCLGGSCHSTGGGAPYSFDSYAGLSSQSSFLIGRLTGTTGNIMPQAGKLDACKINQIRAWVNQGAPNN